MNKVLMTVRWMLGGTLGAAMIIGTMAATGARANVGANNSGAEAQTQQEFQQQGQKAFADRSPDVQQVLQRMYSNTGTYRSMSALFIGKAPGLTPGSMWIHITQPDYVRTDAYYSLDGSGNPVEETQNTGGKTTVLAPGRNAYAVISDANSTLPPISEVPLSEVEAYYGPTSIEGMGAGQSELANDVIHPAGLVTSPFFTDKAISVVGTDNLQGRPVWVLSATQIAGTHVATSLGDGWRMWVDKGTGIIVRLDYLSGSQLIGSIALQRLVIDGVTQDHVFGALSVPGSARQLSAVTYQPVIAPAAIASRMRLSAKDN